MTTILQRDDQTETDHASSGFGALQCEAGNLPLKLLGYHARILNLAVRTTIIQTYYNPFDEPIEATYIFPIEGQHAVVACEMRVTDRVIHAQLKERGQARAEYRRAIQAGHRAALLEENRPETFSMRVGNIPPGEAIQVCLETVAQLPVVHGEWTLRLPLVVSPRYTSGLSLPRENAGPGIAPDTDQVPDASTVTPPTWLPGFASPIDLRLCVDIQMDGFDGMGELHGQLTSSLHAVFLESIPGGSNATSNCRVRVLPGERVDRDFVLRGRVGDTNIQTSVAVEVPPLHTLRPNASKSQGLTFAINIVPPNTCRHIARDVVFLLDRSSSMNGWKMTAARRGMSRLVDSLLPQDRFRVFAFDDQCDELSTDNGKGHPKPMTWRLATDKNRFEAMRWLGQIETRGGTEMGLAIERGLQAFARDESTGDGVRNQAMVLITDGQITGEDSILRLLGTIPDGHRPRLFCVGIDRAVNGSVLQRLAKITGGCFSLVESEKRLDEILNRLADEIGSPAISNLRVEADGTAEIQLAPAHAQTLYTGRSLTVYGRTENADLLSLTLKGQLPDGETWSKRLAVPAHASESTPILLPLWGRARVRELEDQWVSSYSIEPALTRQIIDCSLATQVLSRLTAFVAVDQSERVASGDRPHSIVQPSEYPEGWSLRLPALDQAVLIPISRNPARSTGSAASSHDRKIPPSLAVEQLIKHGRVSQEQVDEATLSSKQNGGTCADALVRLGYVPEEDVARAIGIVTKTSYIELNQLRIDESIIELVPECVARENTIIPVADSGHTLTILMTDPTDIDAIEKLRFILNRNIVPMVGSVSTIREAINRHYGQVEGESADSMLQEFFDTAIDFTETVDDDLDDESDLIPRISELPPSGGSAYDSPGFMAPVVRLLSLIIQEAIQLAATHILLTHKEDRFEIAYVIDGKLMERDSPPRRLLSPILSRLKVLAKLDVGRREGYQTGKFRFDTGGNVSELKVHIFDFDALIEMPSAAQMAQAPMPVLQWWQCHQLV